MKKSAKSNDEFKLLIQTVNDFIFFLDRSGYFVMVNDNGALQMGYKPGEMMGRHFLEFIDEENKPDIAVAFQNILRSDRVELFEAIFLDKLNSKRILEIHGRSRKENGTITGLIGVGRDITQRRYDEDRLRDLNLKLIEANRIISIERDRAKEQISILEELNNLKNDFISNVSHEFRTPLASIVGFAEAIASDPEMPKEMVNEFTTIILEEGKRLARLINDLLDFSKYESGQAELNKSVFDLNILISEISAQFQKAAQEKSVIFSLELPEEPVEIFADREKIKFALSHLVENAVKFNQPGGRVSIIVIDLAREAEIIVSDSGIGIPQADIKNLFDKFYRARNIPTQTPGTGFGLVLVKQIMDMHRASIYVKSEINKGTTFVTKFIKDI